ncbi:MAG TPA: hypothetical protein VFU34_04565, partial [Gaiellaceae bacterium]|nr:hypothetical protein [Gaiellaceae bacterium]
MSVLVRYRRSSRLGELLVRTNALTAEQLAIALAEQRRCKQSLGEVALQLKYVTEAQLRHALCLQLHISFFDLDTIAPDISLRALINPRFAKTHLVVPVARVGRTLVVAMDDPTRPALIDDLKSSTGLDIEVITSTTASIRRTLARVYPGLVEPDSNEPESSMRWRESSPIVDEPHVMSFDEIDRVSEDRTATDLEVTRAEGTSGMVRRVLSLALERGASDIHLEAVDRGIEARFRID